MTLAETGVVGLAALALLQVTFLCAVWRTRKYFLPTERHYSFLVLGGALVVSRLAHGMVDHYWTRGTLLIGWGCAGMAVGAYYAARERARESGRL
jgi:hypothetical protein